jgi:imidazolonepropionase-like amidohydrolase
MVKNGVTLLAGTDANVPTAVPGFSMHDELQSLTKAGMTPSQALLAATATPAKWMKVKSGKVVQGYNADLVLLDANPLIDIKNTKTINTVISNGRLIPRQQLDQMLSEVKTVNDQSRKTDIDQFH